MSEDKSVKIHVENLTKKFGDLLVLDNISFDIKKGEFVCVVGPTGCGKTTFLNLLSCLIEPTGGKTSDRRATGGPEKARHRLCVSGAVLISLAQCGAEYRDRYEDQKDTGAGAEGTGGADDFPDGTGAVPQILRQPASVSTEQRMVIAGRLP